MSIRQLWIYQTMHRADSVSEHLERLEDWAIEPGFIGLEGPKGDRSGIRKFTFKYPATILSTLAWMKVSAWIQFKGSTNATQAKTEFKAGRKYGDDISATVANVDRNPSEIFADYLSPKVWVIDTISLILSAILWMVVAVLLINAPLAQVIDSGITGGEFVGILVYVIAVGVFSLFAVAWFGSIPNRFVNGIRDLRDEAMYKNTVEKADLNNCDSALIIAGLRHSSGIQENAESDDIAVEVRAAPSVQDYEPDHNFGFRDVYKLFFR